MRQPPENIPDIDDQHRLLIKTRQADSKQMTSLQILPSETCSNNEVMPHAPEEQADFYKFTHKFLMMLFLVTIERRLFSEVFPLEDIKLFYINFILRFQKPVHRP